MSNTSVRKPKHHEILDTLLLEIGSGKYRDGEQLPTDMALAERFRVSRPTVSRAVHELVRRGMVHRRAGLGTFVRQNPTNGRMVFGFLVPELGDSEIFEPICGNVVRIIQRQGHALQWADTQSNSPHLQTAETAAEACRGFIDRGVAGIFLAPFVTPPGMQSPNETIVRTLRKAGIAVVLLDRDIVPFPQRSDFDLVGVDHLRGQARMTEYLIALGHRRLAFWSWKNSADTLRLRGAGFLQAMAEAGIPADPQLSQACDPDDVQAIAQLMNAQQPDAVMCANDVFAAHLMKTLEKLDMRVPRDVSVVGYDDVRYAHLLQVPLTTISQPCEEIGAAAAQLMLERVAHPELPPREILVTPSLAIRESTATAQDDR